MDYNVRVINGRGDYINGWLWSSDLVEVGDYVTVDCEGSRVECGFVSEIL